MNSQQTLVCSDVFSVDLDDDLESGTLAFVLKDASSLLEVRLPAKGIVALRDTLSTCRRILRVDLKASPSPRSFARHTRSGKTIWPKSGTTKSDRARWLTKTTTACDRTRKRRTAFMTFNHMLLSLKWSFFEAEKLRQLADVA